ncbi:PIN domain-containing protein [Nitratifractor sp.]
MTLLDANIILRYLLREDEERFDEAVEIIESTECLILAEVLANVVYVLNGYYNVP